MLACTLRYWRAIAEHDVIVLAIDSVLAISQSVAHSETHKVRMLATYIAIPGTRWVNTRK